MGQVVAGTAAIVLGLNSKPLFDQLEKVVASVQRKIQQVGIAAAATGAAVSAGLALAANQAEKANARLQYMEAVLGDSAAQAHSLASAINNDVGLAVASVTAKMAEFALQGEDVGLLREQALSLGDTVIRLGADMDRAFGKSGSADVLQKAILGSADAARQLGLTLSDAAVSAEFGRPIEQMTEVQKAATRAAMAQRQLQESGVAGSATASALAVAQGRLSESFSQLTNAIGGAAQPGIDWVNNVLAGILDIGTSVIDWTTEFITQNSVVVEVVANVSGAMTVLGSVLATVGSAIVGFVGSIALMVAKSMLLKMVLGYIPVVGPIILKVMAAIKVAILAVAAVGAAAAGVFVGIAAAVAAVAYGIYRLHKATGILNPALRAMGQIGAWLKGIWDAIANAIGGVIGKIMKLFGLGKGSGGGGGQSGGKESSGRKPSTGGQSGGGVELTGAQQSAVQLTKELKDFAEDAKGSLQTPQDKFKEMTAKLREAADRGLLSPQEFQALFERAQDDLDEALKVEWESSEAGKRDKMLSDFGSMLTNEVRNLEEEVSERVALINQALEAGKITQETANRAIEAANNKIKEAAKGTINEAADLKASIANARGGKDGAAASREIEEQRIADLKASGNSSEAMKREIALMGDIISSASKAAEDAKPQKQVMSTRSASEAMFGRTGTDVDKERLQAEKDALEEQRKGNERLDRILAEVEG